MTSDDPAAAIVHAADRHLYRLIRLASRGDKAASRELHRHIRQDLDHGVPLDDRLTRYVTDNGLPPMGKEAEDDSFPLAVAVAFMINRGESRQDAIEAVAGLSFKSFKTVEASFKGETRKAAEEWVNDPEKRRVLLALVEPYI